MLDRAFAERFAAEWIDAWNSHDLDRVLSHYADDFEMSSPYIAQVAGEPFRKTEGQAGRCCLLGQRSQAYSRLAL